MFNQALGSARLGSEEKRKKQIQGLRAILAIQDRPAASAMNKPGARVGLVGLVACGVKENKQWMKRWAGFGG